MFAQKNFPYFKKWGGNSTPRKKEGVKLKKKRNSLFCNQPIVGSQMKSQNQILNKGLHSDLLSPIL
jgi:hypothetical protein